MPTKVCPSKRAWISGLPQKPSIVSPVAGQPRIINAYHYGADSESNLSESMFDQYLDLLDGNRLYFTAADIEDLKRYRPHLHESLKSADLEPAFDIFNRYVKRRERAD